MVALSCWNTKFSLTNSLSNECLEKEKKLLKIVLTALHSIRTIYTNLSVNTTFFHYSWLQVPFSLVHRMHFSCEHQSKQEFSFWTDIQSFPDLLGICQALLVVILRSHFFERLLEHYSTFDNPWRRCWWPIYNSQVLFLAVL